MAKKQNSGAMPSVGKLRINRKALTMLLVLPLVVALTWFFFTSPAKQKAQENTAAAEVTTGQLEQIEARISAIKNGQETEASALKAQADRLDVLLPKEFDPISGTQKVIALAQGNGLDVTQISQPTAGTPEGSSLGYAATITVSGSFNGVTAFISQLNDYPQLLTVSNVNIATSAEGQTTATLTVTYWTHQAETLADIKNSRTTTPVG